jgi:GTP cyclohydrolase I
MVNQNRIKRAMVSIIEAIGEDPLREGIKDTPQRVAEMYSELFSGLDADPRAELAVDFGEGYE